MKPIGGDFELELAKGNELYADAIKLFTGRNCLEYILHGKLPDLGAKLFDAGSFLSFSNTFPAPAKGQPCIHHSQLIAWTRKKRQILPNAELESLSSS